MATVKFNLGNIKDEVLNKLRYGLNSFDSKSRIAESVKTFAGTGSQTRFLISTSGMNYIKTITVDGSIMKFATDYIIHWRGTYKNYIEFTVAPANASVILVTAGVKVAKGSFVFPDFPRTDLSLSNYPRVGFKVYSSVSPAGLGGRQQVTNRELLIQVKIVGIDTREIDDLVGNVEDFIASNAKNFYNLPYIEPTAINEYDNFDDNTSTSFSKVIEFKVTNKISTAGYVDAIN